MTGRVMSVDARYRPILTINLIRKLEGIAFLARILIQNNVNSICPLEISAMKEFE
jgi:hypothetical protein